MAASPRIPAATANAMLEAGIGSRANNGKLKLYSGVQPTAGGGAIGSQVLLAMFTMAADAFPVPAGGVLTAAAISAATGLAEGDATWYRLTMADGATTLIDGSVGLTDADVLIDDIHITVGEAVAVTSFQITQPLA